MVDIFMMEKNRENNILYFFLEKSDTNNVSYFMLGMSRKKVIDIFYSTFEI